MIEAKVLTKYVTECVEQNIEVELFNNSAETARGEVEVKVGYRTIGREKVELKPYEKRRMTFKYKAGPVPGLGPMSAPIYVLINGEVANLTEVPVLPLKPTGMLAAVGAFLLATFMKSGLQTFLANVGGQLGAQLSQYIPFILQMSMLMSYMYMFEYMTNLSSCVKF